MKTTSDNGINFLIDIRLTNSNNQRIFGKGLFDLLRQLKVSSSIHSLSSINNPNSMSYSKAMNRISDFEKTTNIKLLDRKKGGANRQGSSLTPEAEKLLILWENLETKLKENNSKMIDDFFKEFDKLQTLCPNKN